nr:hypothetical protein [uncultured Desulfobacter sp.]
MKVGESLSALMVDALGSERRKGGQKDRTRFRSAWREPKLLSIYVVNAQGKQEKSFSPFIDGCFNGPDGVFHLLKGHLTPFIFKTPTKYCLLQMEHIGFGIESPNW